MLRVTAAEPTETVTTERNGATAQRVFRLVSLFKQSVHNAVDTGLQKRFSEIDDEGETKTGKSEVCQRLSVEDFMIFACRFALDDYTVGYDEDWPEGVLQLLPFVDERYICLPCHLQTTKLEFENERFFVN